MSPKSWVLLAVVIGAIVVVWRLYVYAEGVGYDRGSLETARRDNVQLMKVNDRIRELEAEKAALEAKHAAEMEAIDDEGQRELRRVNAAKERFVSDVVAGRIRLFDLGNKPGTCGGGGPAPSTPATASVDHGAEGAGLSEEASRFLLEEAGRADSIVVQLRACQNVLLSDRGRAPLPPLAQ